jgi:hypothetical protein
MGAKKLAQEDRKYTALHKSHGIDQSHWELLTQGEYWTPDQARQIRSILANMIEISMTIAGMPAIPMPGQYVAALIAEIVAPCNRMLACVKSPDTFDATDASGLFGTHEVKDMSTQQLMSLVLAYSGDTKAEPGAHMLPADVVDQVSNENKSVKK